MSTTLTIPSPSPTISPNTQIRLCNAPWMEPKDLPKTDVEDVIPLPEPDIFASSTRLIPASLLFPMGPSHVPTKSAPRRLPQGIVPPSIVISYSSSSTKSDDSECSTCFEVSVAYSPVCDDVLPVLPMLSSEISDSNDRVNPCFDMSEGREVLFYSDAPAPDDLFFTVNDSVRSTFDYPDFDFDYYIRTRCYHIRSLDVHTGKSVVLLDKSVLDLVPASFPDDLDDVKYTKATEVRPSSLHRFGLFSRQVFQAEEEIVQEHPAVVTPFIIGAASISDMYGSLFSRLPSSTLEEIHRMALHSTEDEPPRTGDDFYEDIINIHSLAIQLDVPTDERPELQTHRGIFLKTSWCNHSCGPNAMWTWDHQTFTLKLTALRSIDADEEITIPYISPALPFDVRKEALESHLGFSGGCKCAFCSRPADVLTSSDASRDFVLRFWSNVKDSRADAATADGDADTDSNTDAKPDSTAQDDHIPSFETWCTDPSYSDEHLIDLHKKAIKLIKEEGLEMFDLGPGDHPAKDQGRHLDAIAMCYGALEDEVRFEKWTQRAADARVLALTNGVHDQLGERSSKQAAFDAWLKDPTTFPLWGFRTKTAERRNDGKGNDEDKPVEGEEKERKSWIEMIREKRLAAFRRFGVSRR